MLTAYATSALGDETVYPVRPHDVAIVEGGGGFVQHVPFNIPGYGSYGFSGLGALTDDDKNKLAEQVKNASLDTSKDVRAILVAIADAAERSDVAVKAIALGGDATRINNALQSATADADFKKLFKPLPTPVRIAWGVIATASFAASVYHGYKRNDSIGWAIWWGAMGALFPIITPTIAFAQGYAKPKRGGFGRRRRRRSTLKHYRRRA